MRVVHSSGGCVPSESCLAPAELHRSRASAATTPHQPISSHQEEHQALPLPHYQFLAAGIKACTFPPPSSNKKAGRGLPMCFIYLITCPHRRPRIEVEVEQTAGRLGWSLATFAVYCTVLCTVYCLGRRAAADPHEASTVAPSLSVAHLSLDVAAAIGRDTAACWLASTSIASYSMRIHVCPLRSTRPYAQRASTPQGMYESHHRRPCTPTCKSAKVATLGPGCTLDQHGNSTTTTTNAGAFQKAARGCSLGRLAAACSGTSQSIPHPHLSACIASTGISSLDPGQFAAGRTPLASAFLLFLAPSTRLQNAFLAIFALACLHFSLGNEPFRLPCRIKHLGMRPDGAGMQH